MLHVDVAEQLTSELAASGLGGTPLPSMPGFTAGTSCLKPPLGCIRDMLKSGQSTNVSS